jgi:streptomycin 6-kinase
MLENLPGKFVRLMNECHGTKGAEWLAKLPEITAEIEREWSLVLRPPYKNLSYHFVAPCELQNGSEAVLKIGYPEENSLIFNEAETLKLYAGCGAVELLKLDGNRLVMLIEKLNPGETLKNIFAGDEDAAIETAVDILRKIVRKPSKNHSFVFLQDWFAGFEKAKKSDFPAAPLEKAHRFYKELSAAESFLIHGDFHHENVLSAEREKFLVIDPKGIIGQIGYEISVFLNNHVWWLEKNKDLSKKLDYAVSKFSEAFEISASDLRKWAYAQGVLSAWWTSEENGENWKKDLALADVWEV